MDVVVARTVSMEQAALKQVGLARGGRLVDCDRQIVVALPIRTSHSGEYVAVAAAHISLTALPLEKVDAWSGHILAIIPAQNGERPWPECRNRHLRR